MTLLEALQLIGYSLGAMLPIWMGYLLFRKRLGVVPIQHLLLGLGVCMAGWERPGQEGAEDHERRFETIWSVEPDAVRDATAVGLELLQRFAPELIEELPPRLREPPAAGAADVRTLIALTNRMIGYSEAGERVV